jgi:hypothetical protein
MRKCLILVVVQLCYAGIAQAQTANCTVVGHLLSADGSPAAQTQLNVISVVNSGSSFVLTPIVLSTDADGLTSFTVPRLSIVWIVATALGLTGQGDVAVLIPDAASAQLEVLASAAKPPLLLNVSSGSSPTLALSLQDFGINMPIPPAVQTFNNRSGAVALTSGDISTALSFTPLDPGTVVGAVNASSGQIDDARLSLNVVRRNVPNIFSAPQTFSNGLQLKGNVGISGDVVATGPYRFQFPVRPASNGFLVSAQMIGDPGAADVNLAVTSVPNTGSVRNNTGASWGYNNDGAGARVVPTEPALDYRIESFYSPSPGKEYMESHLQYHSTRGKILRPFAFQIDRNTDESALQIQTDAFSYLGSDDLQYVKFVPHGVLFLNKTSLASYVNNHPFLQQLNAASTHFVNLLYLDYADRIQLGGGAAATDVIVTGSNLYVGHTNGVKLTSSGGAGLALSTSNGDGAFLAGTKVAGDFAPPAAGGWKLYAKDDGTGKTQLCVEFSSGPPQCFARQP